MTARRPIALWVAVLVAVMAVLLLIAWLLRSGYREVTYEQAPPVTFTQTVDQRGVAMLCSGDGACVLAETRPYVELAQR